MLGVRGRKILLGCHILLISIWLGSLISILILLLSKGTVSGIDQIDSVDKTVFLLSDLVIMNIAVAVGISGLLFSMFTNWGFFKFYWVITKWVILVILAVVIIFFAGPSLNGMAATSDVFKEQVRGMARYAEFEGQAIVYTCVQLILLATVVFVSVLKPWGKRTTKRLVKRKFVVATGVLIGLALSTSVLMQYLQLSHYRTLQINEVDLSSVADGQYVGKVDYSFQYEVEVIIENQTIKDIKFLKNRDSHYARLAEGIKKKIIDRQKINIDTVTGATTTSKIMMKVIEKALE